MKHIFITLTFTLFLFSSCEKDPVPFEEESLPDNYIHAVYIHSDGVKYFATKRGLASFDGTVWKTYHSNSKIAVGSIYDIGYEQTTYGDELWLGTDKGVNVISMPVDALSGATSYTKENTKILFPDGPGLAGNSVFTLKIDSKNIRWFGTQEGLSAFSGNQWPEINLGNHYDVGFFANNQITSLDYSGDTLYIGTKGGGVARMVSSMDAITAASPYEIPWSALPSNQVLSVFTDGAIQWYGTDEGVVKHTGMKAKSNWESFYEQDGLVNNTVQCIQKDTDGNMWFGTPEGLSKFDGMNWENYTKTDGLISNNILCIAVDLDGSLWFGTDKGISHFTQTIWTSYQAK
ncbi:MAG: two-component regulator propeller domain-containing protein [Mariniphaga sp.]